MRILNLQNTILLSMLVAGAAASVACSSSDTPRPGDATAGTGNVTSSGGSGNATSTGGTGNVSATAGTGNVTSTGGTGAGTAGSTSGTAGSGTGGAAPSVCDGVASRVLMNTPEDAFIDDFEAAMISPAWYGFQDLGSPGGDAADSMIKLLQVMPGAATTAHAGEYKGTGANPPTKGMGSFGVGLEINVGVDKSINQFCVDASAFTGVSFWAKAAASTEAKISAGFVIPQQNQKMFGGDCSDTDAANCNNYPQSDIVLTTDWAQYTVDFATAKGTKGAKVVNGKVQQILFLSPDASWDYSLDEIAFYSGTKPTGPVAPPATGTGGTGAGGGSGTAGASAGGTGGAQ